MIGTCYNCGKRCSGKMPMVMFNEEMRFYCADCLWKLQKEFKNKRDCKECAFFDDEKCKRNNEPFLHVIGVSVDYYPLAEKCKYFTTSEEEMERVQLSNWIRAGRFEDAAMLYEKKGMYDEAGAIRAKARQVSVSNKIVNVDLNALIRQLAEGGIVAVYKCPHCGGKLKVGKTTTADSLKICDHCGSEIETMDIADFLKTALS